MVQNSKEATFGQGQLLAPPQRTSFYPGTVGETANFGTMSTLGTTLGTAQYSTDVGGLTLPSGAQEVSQRKVSSVVIQSQQLEEVVAPEVRYVEVPVFEEVVKHVPVKEVREVVKRVPKVEIEYVERQVEVPQIKYVDQHVEVEKIQEVVRHVPVTQVVDRQVDVVKHVPKVQVQQVEKLVEVPGEVIEVPKPYTVENRVPVSRYHDEEQPLIVAQTLAPIIVEGSENVEVEVDVLEPEIVPVDVHVGKLVSSSLIPGKSETRHRVVTVPSAQYNSMLRFLNSHLSEKESSLLPYVEERGQIPFMAENVSFSSPPPSVVIEGHVAGGIYTTGTPVRAGRSIAHASMARASHVAHSTHAAPAAFSHTTRATTHAAAVPSIRINHAQPGRHTSVRSARSVASLGPVVTQNRQTSFVRTSPHPGLPMVSHVTRSTMPTIHSSLPLHAA